MTGTIGTKFLQEYWASELKTIKSVLQYEVFNSHILQTLTFVVKVELCTSTNEEIGFKAASTLPAIDCNPGSQKVLKELAGLENNILAMHIKFGKIDGYALPD